MSDRNIDGQTLKVGDQLFQILEDIKDSNGLQATELANRLDLPSSTAYVYLNTLVQSGFVVRTEGMYTISHQFLEYATIAREQLEIYNQVFDTVDALAEQTKEKVWCIVEEDGQAVYLYGTDGENAIQTKAFLGKYVELYSLAGGRAILAHLPDDRRDTLLESYKTDPNVDTPSLRDELSNIRERGLAYNKEHHLQSVNAIGAVVIDNTGTVHGALSISGPTNRLTEERVDSELEELLLGTVNEIGVNLSYQHS